MARILIVDDSPTEVKKITTILQKHQHEVLTADNGADGVAKARSETPDLVLMDVVMPGLNGFQATRQLTRAPETASIPVIIVTTKTGKLGKPIIDIESSYSSNTSRNEMDLLDAQGYVKVHGQMFENAGSA